MYMYIDVFDLNENMRISEFRCLNVELVLRGACLRLKTSRLLLHNYCCCYHAHHYYFYVTVMAVFAPRTYTPSDGKRLEILTEDAATCATSPADFKWS